MIIFLVAGALGAVIRYLADFYLPRHGILLVNIIGSCIAGAVLSMTTIFSFDDILVQIVFGGFAGSLTTYSTVAVTAAHEYMHNSTGRGVKTWGAHVGLSIAACLTGAIVALLLLR